MRNDAVAHCVRTLIVSKSSAHEFFKDNKSWITKLNMNFDSLMASFKTNFGVDYHSLPK